MDGARLGFSYPARLIALVQEFKWLWTLDSLGPWNYCLGAWTFITPAGLRRTLKAFSDVISQPSKLW